VTSSATLQALAEVGDDLICTLNLAGHFTDVSHGFLETLGWEEQQLLNSPWSTFVHPDDLGRVRRELAPLHDGSGSAVFHARLKRADQGHEWMRWKAYAGKGEIYSILSPEGPPQEARLELTMERLLREQLGDVQDRHEKQLKERERQREATQGALDVAEQEANVANTKARTLQVLVGAAIAVATAVGGTFAWAIQRIESNAARAAAQEEYRRQTQESVEDNAVRIQDLEGDVRELGRVAVEQQIVTVESAKYISDKIDAAHPRQVGKTKKPPALKKAEGRVERLKKEKAVDELLKDDDTHLRLLSEESKKRE